MKLRYGKIRIWYDYDTIRQWYDVIIIWYDVNSIWHCGTIKICDKILYEYVYSGVTMRGGGSGTMYCTVV